VFLLNLGHVLAPALALQALIFVKCAVAALCPRAARQCVFECGEETEPDSSAANFWRANLFEFDELTVV